MVSSSGVLRHLPRDALVSSLDPLGWNASIPSRSLKLKVDDRFKLGIGEGLDQGNVMN